MSGVYSYIIFLISAKKIDCGDSLEPPRRGGSHEYPQSMFWAKLWKILEFLSENFQFFGGKIFYIFEYVCFRNEIEKTSLNYVYFAFWSGALINPQWLELLVSRTNLHGLQDVRAIEVWL